MKFSNRVLLGTLAVLAVLVVPPGRAQTKTQTVESKTAPPLESDAQKNVQVYIDLLRRDVRQEKAEIMGAVMLLSAQDATKFWPIYSD